MSTPLMYLGMAKDGSSVADIWRVNSGSDDDGTDISPLMQSLPVAPAGIGGEAVFNWLYITVTHTMAVTVQVTPILDGTDLEALSFALTTKSDRTRVTKRFSLFQGYDGGTGTNILRHAPRGESLAVKVEVGGSLGAGDLIIDRVEVDADIVMDARSTENES